MCRILYFKQFICEGIDGDEPIFGMELPTIDLKSLRDVVAIEKALNFILSRHQRIDCQRSVLSC